MERNLRPGPLVHGDEILAIDGDETVRESGSYYKIMPLPNGKPFLLRIRRGSQILEFPFHRIRGNPVKQPWHYAELLLSAAVFLLTATWIGTQKPDSLQARLAWLAGVTECWMQIFFAVGETGYNNVLPLWFLPLSYAGLASGPALYFFFESFHSPLPLSRAWRSLRAVEVAACVALAILNTPESILPFHFEAGWAYWLQHFYVSCAGRVSGEAGRGGEEPFALESKSWTPQKVCLLN